MRRPSRTPHAGPLRERIDALIDRLAESDGGPSDEESVVALEGLSREAEETSLNDNRPRVPGA